MRPSRPPLWRRVANRLGLYTRRQVDQTAANAVRGYDAAKVNRLTEDWLASNTSGDAEIRPGNLRRIIARSRDLVRNNDYARGFLIDVEANIIGAVPFDLRMDVHEMTSSGKKQIDRVANNLIEQGWGLWSKRQNASLDKQSSWRALKRSILRAVVQDGGVLIQHIRGARARNPFGYAVRLIEIDQLDFDANRNLPDGGTVRLGVEKDVDGVLRAFYVFRNHPGDDMPAQGNRVVDRIPASEITLFQLPERITQTLAVSWFAAAMLRLRHLGEFEEAAVIAARVGACQGGFFKTTPSEGQGYPNDQLPGTQHTVDAEPGLWEQLPPGLEPIQNKPNYPNTEFGEFRKAMLRGIATGWGQSYTSLGNDLESVNYSSARVGLLDEREVWKILQLWFAEDCAEVIFGEWLTMSLATGAVKLPISKLEKFNQPRFKPRRWPWVDPLKDMLALELAIQLRVGSRRQGVDEMGGDIEDVFASNKADEDLAESLDLSLQPPDPTEQAAAVESTSTSTSTSTNSTAGKPPAKPVKTDRAWRNALIAKILAEDKDE